MRSHEDLGELFDSGEAAFARFAAIPLGLAASVEAASFDLRRFRALMPRSRLQFWILAVFAFTPQPPTTQSYDRCDSMGMSLRLKNALGSHGLAVPWRECDDLELAIPW